MSSESILRAPRLAGVELPLSRATPWLQTGAMLLAASAAMLFFEMLMIRWLCAEIRIFAYFHNLVLLFCFVGTGLGFATADAPPRVLRSLAALDILALALRFEPWLGPLGLRNTSAYLSRFNDMIVWYRSEAVTGLRGVAELCLGVTLMLVVTGLLVGFFVPFGRIVGRGLAQHERPLRVYALNLAGSLVGVLLFHAMSWARIGPGGWIGVGGALVLCLLAQQPRSLALAVPALAVAGLAAYDAGDGAVRNMWSPYQKITVRPLELPADGKRVPYGHVILANNVGYMATANYSAEFQRRFPSLYPPAGVPYDHYNIAYRFAERLDDALVLGPGVGNDVAGALRNGARRVTAVEIDPVILKLGRELHPERPYDDPRVRLVNDDARSFLRRSDETFDVIVFGLLDSMTLSSSHSNVRLDNFVYTLESMRQVRRLLRPGGVVVLLFEVEDEFVGARLQRLLRQTIGEPLGFVVRSGLRGWGGYGFVSGDENVLRRRLSADPVLSSIVDENRPLFHGWDSVPVEPTTDDWPYLYLRSASVPWLHVLVFGMLTACAAIGMRAPLRRRWRPDLGMLGLGAGFMIIEARSITKLALLFGNTWVVSAIVVSAILCTILLANLAVWLLRARASAWHVAGIVASLGLLAIAPLEQIGLLAAVPRAVVSGALVSVPVFFAGILFSTALEGSAQRSDAMASNLIGAVIGGALESLSFVVGMNGLLAVAAAIYVLAWLGIRQRVAFVRSADVSA